MRKLRKGKGFKVLLEKSAWTPKPTKEGEAAASANGASRNQLKASVRFWPNPEKGRGHRVSFEKDKIVVSCAINTKQYRDKSGKARRKVDGTVTPIELRVEK